eukprot:1298448-Rhodomonas_salina.2
MTCATADSGEYQEKSGSVPKSKLTMFSSLLSCSNPAFLSGTAKEDTCLSERGLIRGGGGA